MAVGVRGTGEGTVSSSEEGEARGGGTEIGIDDEGPCSRVGDSGGEGGRAILEGEGGVARDDGSEAGGEGGRSTTSFVSFVGNIAFDDEGSTSSRIEG